MTGKPYTPTTETVRFAATFPNENFSLKGSDFDRWLATVEAAAEQRGAVKAWRNGYVHGVHDERLREQIGAAEEPNRANPHVTNNRAGQMEGDE